MNKTIRGEKQKQVDKFRNFSFLKIVILFFFFVFLF